MSIVVRGGVARSRRVDVGTTGIRVDRPAICPFATIAVRLRNTGEATVRMVFEETQFALAPAETHYAELQAGEVVELPLEITGNTGPNFPKDGLWLRSEAGTITVELIFFQKR